MRQSKLKVAYASGSVWSLLAKAMQAAAVTGLLLCMGACQPWGKPGPEEPAPDQITDFKTLFSTNCSGCHGINGRNGPGRILNDALYLAIIPRQTLQQTIENGRPGTAMPAFARSQGGPLTPKQVNAIVNGIESQWAGTVSAGDSLLSYSASGSGDPASGKKLFTRDCYMCHGPGAPIGAVTDKYFLSLVSDQGLRTSILIGRPDLGMPDYRSLNMGHALREQDMEDLVAFLVSQRPPEATAMLESGGQAAHVNENGPGTSGQGAAGNEGSGYGPGSPQKHQNQGNQYHGSSQRGVK